MDISIENSLRRSKRTCDPRRFAVPSNSCPGSRLLALWLTGCWICPVCGGPDPALAASLDEEYTESPNDQVRGAGQDRCEGAC
jgi:hypothetical protein